jgi:hypothetical protein
MFLVTRFLGCEMPRSSIAKKIEEVQHDGELSRGLYKQESVVKDGCPTDHAEAKEERS